MIDDKYISLVTEYLEGTLSETDRIQLQSLIDRNEIDILDLVDLERIYKQAGSLEVPEPGQRVHDRFYRFLEESEHSKSTQSPNKSLLIPKLSKNKVWFNYLAIAASLVVGIFIGDIWNPMSDQDEKIDLLSAEVTQMREVLMISLLQNDSPVERLRAVNISQQIPETDNRLVEALLNTLNTDSNVNVRVAAINALVERGGDPSVRQGLIESISSQTSPLVQIALADAMITLQESEAVMEFEILLAQTDQMDASVRTKLENTILALK
jgi:hypothetical protein